MHAIISDTHSPSMIDKALKHLQKIAPNHPDMDAIVINGDMLGIFSMEKSNLHKRKEISSAELMNYLKEAAPKFYSQYNKTKQITSAMATDYALERYDWCVETLKKFSKINTTIFNMGNHESPLQFLVMQELPFLTGQYVELSPNDNQLLNQIFEAFESKLYEMEKTHNFKYIRDNHHMIKNTLILGIPGESHSTIGNDPHSIVQEEKTKKLIEKAREDLDKAHSIIIYNHTQGNYNRDTGSFIPASNSLNQFMNELPNNIKQKIFIQSHNHWSHTQFIKNDDFHFILNNAGLHDGIFNIISFDSLNVDCYDIDPTEDMMTRLNLADGKISVKNEEERILRNYPNTEMILARKQKQSQSQEISQQPIQNIQVEQPKLESNKNVSPEIVNEMKKRIFG